MSYPGEHGDGGKVEQATQGASAVASTAKEAAKDTVADAAAQAKTVVTEVREQAGRVANEAVDEFRAQAQARTAQASEGLRRMQSQLSALAQGRTSEAGPLTHYLQQGQRHIAGLADRLDQRGAQGVVDDVTAFARRRPGLFLLCAAGAGFAVGRLVRANAAGATANGSSAPSVAAATTYPSTVGTVDEPLAVEPMGTR